MLTPKYYEKIRKLQRLHGPDDKTFDLTELEGNWLAKLLQKIFQSLWLQRLLRRFLPIVRVGRFVVVTRYDDAAEVLQNQDVFEAPYGLEMTEMAGGTNFILGMRDDPINGANEYQQMLHVISDAVQKQDVTRIGSIAQTVSKQMIDQSGGRIEVIQDLIARVPTRICRDYYGLAIRDEDAFAEWSIALSMLFFADPTGDEKARDMALLAAQRLTRLIDDSVAQAHQRAREGALNKNTVLDRLIEQSERPNSIVNDDMIRAILMGMSTGFVPTNTLAAGNILEVLLKRPQALKKAQQAAHHDDDDDDTLERCLFEAMRFKPPLNPGLFRYATADFTIAKQTPRATRVKPGSTVLVAITSAMHDEGEIERPNEYWPDRPEEARILFGDPGMLFGYNLHKCIGQEIARAQITHMFKALLRQEKLRPAAGRSGKMRRIGPFPYRMELQYGNEQPADVAMVTICAKLADYADERAIEAKLNALGNPAAGNLKVALDKRGYVHFASICLVPDEKKAGDQKHRVPGFLILELSADGKQDDVIDRVADDARKPLRDIFKTACGLSDDEHLAVFMQRHALVVKPRLFKTHGLTFCGTPWLSVERIKQEDRLQKKIADVVSSKFGQLPHDVLDNVRKELRNDTTGSYAFAFNPAPIPFLDSPAATWAAERDSGILKKISDYIIHSPMISAFLLLLSFFFTYLAWVDLSFYIAPISRILGTFLAENLVLLVSFVISLILGTVAALVSFVVVIGIFGYLLIHRVNSFEKAEQPRDLDPAPERVCKIMKRENSPGCVQNHMFAISLMKPGLVRKITLFVSLFAIEKLATMATFRPGFLSDIGTIHFARWVRLPKTDKLLFFSNYSGSWESYLEDFITKAHNGLTAVWSNTNDFPRSRNLFQDGATDGDRFKRWARRQQMPTLFWYSGYPHLTTDRIRTNALIRDGLSRARSESDAAAWLSLFNSVPRPATALQLDEIQTLMFGGMGDLEEAHCFLITFCPGEKAEEKKKKCRLWLNDMRERLAFGERLPDNARALALSASGLQALGLTPYLAPDSSDGEEDPLTSFPFAFLSGMANETRSRILGDFANSAPDKWDWGNRTSPVDAILLVYARTPEALKKASERDRALLQDCGHTAKKIALKLGSKKGKFTREPFGFIDGISQPVIRGTQRYLKGVDECHVVAAGELILGYPDQRGKFPPTPQVYAGDDPHSLLPNPPDRLPKRFPAFDPRSTNSKAPRDFGRNGSYLVVRQIEQYVDTFKDYLNKESAQLRLDYPDVCDIIDQDWLAAKMIGRWPDGASLVRNPNPDKRSSKPDNDFYFGRDDPQGYRCPFGAHIRRANPRDTFKPGDFEQVSMITNRHRILRVGRPYEEDSGKGLMFMCINADIERQFEFIQQTWLQAPSFSGLEHEIDPIGLGDSKGHFSIPTPGGAIVVQGLKSFIRVRGGGYFFLPSRRALKFLSQT
jgi:cytochrome P450/deferrochelatase/peroxidase EfeB